MVDPKNHPGSPERARIRITAPEGLTLKEALRLIRVARTLRRMIRRHGYDRVADALEHAGVRNGRVTVRRTDTEGS